MADDKKQIIAETHINELMNYLHKGTIIPDDMMYSFCKKITKLARSHYYSEAVTEHAKDFCLYMSHLWSSQFYKSSSYDSTFIFQLGELHACARILDDFFSEIERQKNLDDDIKIDDDCKRYITKIGFFEKINDNPGIKHSVLADEIGVSISYLSQFVAQIRDRGYHYERIAGREKYYYLTKTGSQLLARMEKISQPSSSRKKTVNYINGKTSLKVPIKNKPNWNIKIERLIIGDSKPKTAANHIFNKYLSDYSFPLVNSDLISEKKFESSSILNTAQEEQDTIMQLYEDSNVFSDGFDEKAIAGNECYADI